MRKILGSTYPALAEQLHRGEKLIVRHIVERFRGEETEVCVTDTTISSPEAFERLIWDEFDSYPPETLLGFFATDTCRETTIRQLSSVFHPFRGFETTYRPVETLVMLGLSYNILTQLTEVL
jgi:hypothetical protein